jgi:hypothetical protein
MPPVSLYGERLSVLKIVTLIEGMEEGVVAFFP